MIKGTVQKELLQRELFKNSYYKGDCSERVIAKGTVQKEVQ
jgi:hypothetical protein